MGTMEKENTQPPGLWDKINNQIHRIIGPVVAVFLFFMMALTFVDVIGRYIFNSPVVGSFELTEFAMAIVIFFGLTLLCCEEGHVVVDIFDNFIPDAARPLQVIVINLVNFIVMGVISWRLWILAGDHAEYGDRSQFLSLPMAPLVYFMSVMAGLSSIAMLFIMVNSLKTRKN